jgi:hypothetical protein
MRADRYQPSAGPGNPASWNRYSYVMNDPANLTDHSGNQVDGDSTGTCGVDASSPLCAASDGSGTAAGSASNSSNGGCVLDGIPTDCTFVAALDSLRRRERTSKRRRTRLILPVFKVLSACARLASPINTSANGIQIDVDPWNPAASSILGLILHSAFQVIPNQFIGTDNSYGCH